VHDVLINPFSGDPAVLPSDSCRIGLFRVGGPGEFPDFLNGPLSDIDEGHDFFAVMILAQKVRD
jgi:hypothetical protein